MGNRERTQVLIRRCCTINDTVGSVVHSVIGLDDHRRLWEATWILTSFKIDSFRFLDCHSMRQGVSLARILFYSRATAVLWIANMMKSMELLQYFPINLKKIPLWSSLRGSTVCSSVPVRYCAHGMQTNRHTVVRCTCAGTSLIHLQYLMTGNQKLHSRSNIRKSMNKLKSPCYVRTVQLCL